jgi:hypothetical protein
MQRRVDRAFGKIESLVTPGAKFLDDRVAMLGAVREDGQEQQIEMSLEGLTFYT